ncbi:MAG: aldehyde ferredoxin oxidoreductase [Deltaproteobacteria bacterium]|nr:aldehyde ferredoxin oxidoreductase [Deltaproteobacteria bacterium]
MSKPVVQFALLVDASDGSYELAGHDFPGTVGPVDYGLALLRERDCLCIGSGVLAGSIIPGSNRLVFVGRSPAWDGLYVSTMGGAALIWDGTGVSFLAIAGRAERPSAIVLHGRRGRYPRVGLVPVELDAIWRSDEEGGGYYALQRHAFTRLWEGAGTPRVLAVGPASRHTDFGAIGSAKTARMELTPVDCWAGRGGFGSALLQRHNICAVVYGGDFEDEDLTDRAEADGYFQGRFSKTMKLVDLEATTKYRFDPRFQTGGTFGVNFARLAELMLSFNYRSVGWPPERRQALWERLVRDHYLEQFNRETIERKEQAQCGEPCPAVCKKLRDEYKKDYEPYQTMGPLAGVFDQRAAEKLNHRADALGFDAIQVGGQLAWVMECLHDDLVSPDELGLPAGVPRKPVFEPEGFDPVADSAHNAELGLALLELSATPGHVLARGMRAAAQAFGPAARERAVYLANGERGWIVPNQYWVPGMLAPQAVMGKYYVYYEADFRPPREVGRKCVERMVAELQTDNAGMCRFHRGWSERLWEEIVERHFELEIDYAGVHAALARQIHAQGRPVYWESARLEEMVHGYLDQVRLACRDDAVLDEWLARFRRDRPAAARAYWEELRAGIDEAMGALPGKPPYRPTAPR